MNLQSLKESLVELEKTSNIYKYTDIEEELLNIELDIQNKVIASKKIIKWIINNPNHTFPKKKHKWIKCLNSMYKHRTNIKYYEYDDILYLLKSKKIPQSIRNNLKNREYEDDIIFISTVNSKILFNYLYNTGYLYMKPTSHRIYITPYLNKIKVINNNNKRHLR